MKLNIKLTDLELSVEGDMDPSELKLPSAVEVWESLIKPLKPGKAKTEEPAPSDSPPLTFSQLDLVRVLDDALGCCVQFNKIPAVKVGGLWGIGREGGAPCWCADEKDAMEEIQSLLRYRSVLAIFPAPEGEVVCRILSNRDDFELLFGSGSWNESLS